jgi:hypothetical protein
MHISTMRTVRVLTHIKRLDDALGDFLVRISCPCGASRHIDPEALARIVGRSATLAAPAKHSPTNTAMVRMVPPYQRAAGRSECANLEPGAPLGFNCA